MNFEIDNRTKTGHSQHYSFYITPLEIIGISLTGPKNYSDLYSSSIFPKVKVKETTSSWTTYSPKRGGFEVTIPSYYTAYGEGSENPENIELQAYMASDSSYYFVTERNLNNYQYLENKEFEETQIQKEFFMQFDVAPSTIQLENKNFQSKGEILNKNIVLQTKIYGNKYYLIGTVNGSTESNAKFFDSFKINSFNYSENLEKYTDTVNDYSLQMPKNRNERVFLNMGNQSETSKDIFKNTVKRFTIKTETGKKINFTYYKFNKYENQDNLDSIQSNFKKYYTNYYKLTDNDDYLDEYEDAHSTSILSAAINNLNGFKKSEWYKKLFEDNYIEYKIIKEEFTYDEPTQTHKMNYLVGREGSNLAVKNTILFRNDAYIVLENTVEKNDSIKDEFIDRIINSVTFIGLPKSTIFENKIMDYINDAKSEKDTIRYSALNGTYELRVTKEDIPALTQFLKEFEYKSTETAYKNTLLMKLGEIQDEKIITFFENYYKSDNVAAETQISILEALTNQKSKKGYEKIMELLEYDLPLSSSEYDISSLFSSFYADLENSKVLFPKIFQFYSIPEYKDPVIAFCNKLIETKNASANKIKGYQKMILTNTKLEYKRLVSWKQENTGIDDDNGEEYLDEEYVPVEDVISYLNLLEQFKKNKETIALIQKLKKLNILALDIEILRLDYLHNSLTEKDKEALLKNPKKAFLLMQLANSTFNQPIDDVAFAAISNFYNSTKNDTIEFYTKREVTYKEHQIVYYFYKIKEKEPKNYQEKLTSLAFVLKDNEPDLYAYRYFNYWVINDDDKNEKKIETVINSSLNPEHFRATFYKIEPINLYDYDEYEF